MIRGTGVDIIEIERIEESISHHGQAFLDRLFTHTEQEYCKRFVVGFGARYAGRFAAKEAIIKALGGDVGPDFSWKDIEITNDERGKPLVRLGSTLDTRFNHPKITLSISHSKQHAVAMAIWVES